MRAIRALVRHIAEQVDPDEVILFGSYAYGSPQAGSDVDLLVIKDIPKDQETETRLAISRTLPPHSFGIDILVRSRDAIERRTALGDWFLREITSKGKVMYRRKRRDTTGQPEADGAYESLEQAQPVYRPLKESRGMNELAEEWTGIAEADFETARLTLSAAGKSLARVACFHAQQCAEKYLEAFLTENIVEFPRRHPLIPLLELCLAQDEDFEALRVDLKQLEDYAVDVRYPGGEVNEAEARAALASATRVREFVRGKLGLE